MRRSRYASPAPRYGLHPVSATSCARLLPESPRVHQLNASILSPAFRALRPHQWAKNALLAVPALLAHQLDALPVVGLAIVAFSLCASGTYLANDLLDRDRDREHPTKRSRPIASGALPAGAGVGLAIGLVGAAFGLAIALLPSSFTAVLAVYTATTLAYSLWLKAVLLVDVLVLAFLYALRVVAGGAAASVEVSAWLLGFSLFFFLGLALLKRYSELRQQQVGAVPEQTGRGYAPDDAALVLAIGPTCGLLAILVFALYVAGGTGGASGNGGAGQAGNSGAGDSGAANGSGGVGSGDTTAEGLGGGQTTAESLGGGQAASSGEDSSGESGAGIGDGAGANEGSMDAAAAGAANAAASVPGPGEGSLDAAEAAGRGAAARSAADRETPVPDVVGDAAAGAQGAIDVARGMVDRNGTRAAAGILTNGPAGNLPASGFANRADLATRMTRPSVTAAQARGMTPFSPAAASTQVLDDAARTAGRLSFAGRAVGYGVQPAIGAFNEYRDLPADATLGQRTAAVFGGALAEVDDVAVSGAAGLTVGVATTAVGAAPAAPYTGAVAGAAAGRAWDGNVIDDTIDAAVENYVEPFVESAIDDYAVPAAEFAADRLSDAWSGIRSLFR